MGEGLGRTVGRIFKSARGWAEGLAPSLPHDQPEPADALVEMGGFGSNPGRLRMLAYVPARLAARPALVVVLHGCTQSAADYVRGAGWLTLADRFGFALLCPEQRRLNNPRLCFNWFLPDDTTRDQGEPLSIRQMVHTMVARFGLDGDRVFVTGLSAGGAMTSVLLATYPDVFAGGAIIAGLPYGCAHNAHEALRAMFEGQDRPAREWGDYWCGLPRLITGRGPKSRSGMEAPTRPSIHSTQARS